MSVVCMLTAGVLTAFSNLCMRRSIDVSGSTRAFFVIQLLMTFFVVTLLYPLRTGSSTVSLAILTVGFLGGCALRLMKVAIGKAIEQGPSGLIFATVNSACITPAIIFALFLRQFINCEYTAKNAFGSILVLVGLLWAGNNGTHHAQRNKTWMMFALLGFVLHSLFLLTTEWRLYLTKVGYSDTQWFVPMIFVAAVVIHLVIYLKTEQEMPKRDEFFWGSLGGFFNGVCTYFFVLGTEIASSYELPFIFPAFSAALIFSCNLWGQWLYGENINWYASATCLAGVGLSSLG